ncbi:Protein ABHD17C [Seminavis robusta]|uniref:Protein ABHD17C n=1 Tax=Seminavis robusta TaxID=568900 RepID=A0A9N8H9U0_9STRA|nr:Protein ABHD17C [Seminavis robusta]|eukprot:Sro203_g085590.1 Protein ABHD17C (274) ;mRNA; f:47677-48717
MVISSSLVNVFLFKPPPSRPYDFPTIELTTARGQKIAATYVRRRGANVTLLFSHGNAEDLNSSYWYMERIAKTCDVNVMCYDYTGYGSCNESDPSEEDCYADIDAAYEWLLSEKNLVPEQIVLYGRSLGSGPSVYLANRTSRQGRPVAGLILHSPFTSVYRVVFDMGFTMLGDKFSNIDRISELDCKVFIVHGQEDTIVPCEHGQALFSLVPDKMKAEPFFVKGMGHNGFDFHLEVMLMNRINAFLDYHILARRLWMKGMNTRKGSKRRRSLG